MLGPGGVISMATKEKSKNMLSNILCSSTKLIIGFDLHDRARSCNAKVIIWLLECRNAYQDMENLTIDESKAGTCSIRGSSQGRAN